MKKLLISDYDHTLNNGGISSEDLRKARDFIDAGNVLVVASSRTWPSLSSEMTRYKFPYSYLSCANANAIYDQNGQLIYINTLTPEEKSLIQTLSSKVKNIQGIDAYGEYSIDKILYYQLLLEQDKQFAQEILPFLVKYNLEADYYGNASYIFSGRKQKDFAGTLIGLRHFILTDNIFTIGDGLNDLSMIEKYNGFTLPWGNQELKSRALEEVDSFGELVEKIEKGTCLVKRRLK